jgi:hypothetical protein
VSSYYVKSGWAPDGRHVVGGSSDGRVRLWSVSGEGEGEGKGNVGSVSARGRGKGRAVCGGRGGARRVGAQAQGNPREAVVGFVAGTSLTGWGRVHLHRGA